MPRGLLLALRIIFTPIFAFLLFGAFVSCVSVEVADSKLLNADFYLDALEENDAYARVQEEFLQDVEQRDTTDDLIAGTAVTPEELTEVIREVVPEPYIKGQFETNVRAFFAYMRDEEDDPNLYIEVGPILEEMPDAISSYVVDQLGLIRLEPVETYDEFVRGLGDAVVQIESGDRVVVLPTYELTDEERTRVIDEVFVGAGLIENETARKRVDEALQRQDTAAALITVVDAIIDERVADHITELREELDDQDRIDVLQRIADDEGKERDEVFDELEDVRTNVGRFLDLGNATSVFFLLLMAVLLGVLYLPGRFWPFMVPGIALVVLGMLGLIGWAVHWAATPVLMREAVKNNETDLSDSGVDLVADVVETLARDSAGAIIGPVVAVLVLGVAPIVAAAVLRTQQEHEDDFWDEPLDETRSGF